MKGTTCLLISITILFILANCSNATSDETTKATVYYSNGQYTIKQNIIDKTNGIAYGSYESGLQKTGWGILNIETSSKYEDNNQAYASGIVEGFLTAVDIENTFYNLAPNVFGNDTKTPSKETQDFLNMQEDYWNNSVKDNLDDPFWRQAGYIYQQYRGLAYGYELACKEPSSTTKVLPIFAFQMLNGVGDLFDIIPAVNKKKQINWLKLSQMEAEDKHQKQGHCSALIKVTGDLSDLFLSHSSWYIFSNMNRIFKHYNFNFNDKSTKSKKISFSSYPGFLESLDDFYMLESGLTWTQTSNGVIDQSIYSAVKPESLLAWQRVRIASAMASTGPEWFDYFSRNHSGTYANQYMVVNMNLFEPSEILKNDTLWVVEEGPGIVVGSDQTDALRLGYWASFNVPYFKDVYNHMGYPSMVKLHGNYFTHDLCPRAQIFRRDQGNVKDLDSLKKIMRYNDYKNDPYSIDTTGNPNPMYAICSRGDLKSKGPSPGGCYDTKLTSYNYGAKDLKAQAINGPTSKYSTGNLPPFSFTGEFEKYQHDGLPITFDFDFIHVEPEL